MPEAEAPESQDTPASPESDPAEGGTPAPESNDSPATDWEKRYSDLQPEYTRASQEAAQYRQIIDLARQGDPEAIRYLGLDLAEDDDDLEDEDEAEDFRDPRVDALLQEQAQRAEQAEIDSLESYVDGEIDALAKAAKYDLTEAEKDLIFGALAPGDDGNPDVARAFKKVTELRDAHIESYRKSKKASPVEIGSAGTENIDLSNPGERTKYFAALLEAEE